MIATALIFVFTSIGVVLVLTAAVGVVRLPDLFLRMSAVSKAATLGVACIMVASAIYFRDLSISARALAVIAFLMLTAPAASHLIGRAAYVFGVPLWLGTTRDDLAGRYDPDTHALASPPPPPERG